MEKIQYSAMCILIILSFSCSTNYDPKDTNQKLRTTIPISTQSVQIGNQIWTKKNLNVSRYRNGDIIPHITDNEQWVTATYGAWCYYDNNPANGIIYGKLYNWYAAADPRGLAPEGWHIPSFQEYLTLTNFLGVENAGSKMKEAGTQHWLELSNVSTNSSNFTALPGGQGDSAGHTYWMGHYANFWSKTVGYNSMAGFCIELRHDNDAAINVSMQKFRGASIRCIKD